MTIKGTGDNDNLDGTNGADIFLLDQGGNDTVLGRQGPDIFRFGSNFTADDSVNGGGGADRLSLDGDYTGIHAVTFGAQTMIGVENIWLFAGNSYDLTTNDATVAAGRELHINAKALGTGDTLTFNGSAEQDGDFLVKFGSGFSTSDQIAGGAGDDTLFLNGDYSAGFTFASGQLASVETLRLGGGHSYNLTMGSGNVAPGGTLLVDGTGLGAIDALTFNASAESAGSFDIRLVSREAHLTGGQAGDIFTIDADAAANVLSTANIDGQGGNDTLLVNGNGYAGFSLTQIGNIETIAVADGHTYGFSIDGTHMPSGTLTIDGSALTGTNALNFDGSSVAGGAFDFIGGLGGDTMALGGPAVLRASTVDGGAGSDTLFIDGDYSAGFTIRGTEIHSVETIVPTNTGAAYVLSTADSAVARGATLTIDGSGLTAASLTFDGSLETNGSFVLTGGQSDDVLTGGAGNDTFHLEQGGNDTAHGGGGDDTFAMGATFDASDSIDGGIGNNTLAFEGTYANLAIDSTNVAGVEDLAFGDGFAGNTYNVTLLDDISGGQTIAVSTSFDVASSTLTLDASGSDDAISLATGLFGTVHITGSAQDDTFDYGFNLTSTIDASSFDGGAGNDTLIIDAQLPGTMTLSGVSNVETVKLANSSFTIDIADSVTAAGATLAVDASALTSGSSLTFDGSAETDGQFDLIVGGSNGSIVLGAAGSTVTLDGDGYSVTAGAVTEAAEDTFTFNGSSETLVDGGDVFHAIVTGFDHATDGDLIHLAAADTVATTVLVNGDADTLITLSDGATIVLKGITHVDASFFG